MRIVSFEARHLEHLRLQPQQMAAGDIIASDPSYIQGLTAYGKAFTALVDGEPICCAGVTDYGDGRGYAWALFAEHSGRHFIRLCRSIRRYLEVCDYRRVEATVDCRFAAAIRLGKLMGFEIEGRMKAYARDGADHYMLGRVR